MSNEKFMFETTVDCIDRTTPDGEYCAKLDVLCECSINSSERYYGFKILSIHDQDTDELISANNLSDEDLEHIRSQIDKQLINGQIERGAGYW